jgi:outer membrane immunogenic protein
MAERWFGRIIAFVEAAGHEMRGNKSMRKSTLAVAAATVFLWGGAAMAADLGHSEDIYASTPVYSWTGFYVGANGGYGWGGEHQQVVAYGPAHMDFYPMGGVAGGQVGYNIQTKGVVLGVEATADWSGVGDHTHYTPPMGVEHENINNDSAFADISGRLGLALGRVLVYGKGGVAWGWFDHNYVEGGDHYTSKTVNQIGWLAGGGIEFALSPNWTTKIEYNYMDFGTGRFALNGTVVQAVDFHDTISVIKGGVNYKFGSQQAELLK